MFRMDFREKNNNITENSIYFEKGPTIILKCSLKSVQQEYNYML